MLEARAGKFQFHNGSIKSVSDIFVVDEDDYVSIPQWFD